MHLGLIPDGNRRWCRAAPGRAAPELLARLTAGVLSVLRVALGWGGAAGGAAELLGGVRELSLYVLSLDNLEKRRAGAEDATLPLVYGMLDVLQTVVWAGAALQGCEVTPAPEGAPPAEESDRLLRVGVGVGVGVGGTRILLDARAVRAWPLLPLLQAATAPAGARLLLRALLPRPGALAVSPGAHALLPGMWSWLGAEEGQEGAGAGACRVLLLEEASEGERRAARAGGLAVLVRCAAPGPARRALAGLRALAADTRIRVFGRTEALPEARHAALLGHLQSLTRECRAAAGLPAAQPARTLNLAVAYDPVADVRAQLLAAPPAEQRRPIDLVVRTSGEMRSSGFFPLQTLYSEWAYLAGLFPDVGPEEVAAALRAFRGRDRRFGA